MKPIYRAGQVAEIVGCGRTYVAQRTNKKGGIKGQKIGGYYVYTQDSVDKFKELYKPRGKAGSFDTTGGAA